MLRVSPDGAVVTVARFHPQEVSTDHIPDFPEPTLMAEAVPTGIAIGRDGFAYVSELKGFPFRPGSSNVWRVNPWGEDIECDPTAPSWRCSVARTGFTALVDIAINTTSRKMYLYSLGEGGVPAFEEGFTTGVFPPAVLLEVSKRGGTRQLAEGKLSQPGGVVVAKDGAVFVTDNVFTEFGGRLLRIRT
jgi:glucose/arabinose dehydrogenase